jgi:hypothetical protein
LFRARLILHERVRTVFGQSLAFARRTGYFRTRKLKVVLDTTYVLGRGAVKDTYNLLADGITRLARALATGTHSKTRRSGRGSTTWGAISARLLRERRALTGTIPKPDKCLWKAWLRMRIAC